MQMEREKRNGNYSQFCSDHHVIDFGDNQEMSSLKLLPVSSLTSSPPFASASGGGFGGGFGGVGYIDHPVSKMDTLAGVAIKYGVEVADIKRMNGLVTDLQMFALKSLHIPLPGRHPPSPCLSNGSETPGHDQTPPGMLLFESFQSLRPQQQQQREVSPAMNSLQGYYGLKPEKEAYRKGSAHAHYLEDGPFTRHSSPGSQLPFSRHRKTRSLANGFFVTELFNDILPVAAPAAESSDKWNNEKMMRRRQKSEADFNSRTPETLLMEDNNSIVGGGFSTITGKKGLALRPKAAASSRTPLATDGEGGLMGDSPRVAESSFGGVRKSSSTSCLQDQENRTSKWSNLKPDLQALSTAATVTRPIFDGLPKPITARRNKAALD